MNINYEKVRAKIESGGNPWTSYSDLFLVLSAVFLLLYVVANIRSGTMSFAQQATLMKSQKEVEDLKRQIAVYQGLKDDYLNKSASNEEKVAYEEAMQHLVLLSTRAAGERRQNETAALAAKEKEEKLNQYQLLIRNIIDGKFAAQAKLKQRNQALRQRDQVIRDQQDQLAEQERELEQTIEQLSQDHEAALARTRGDYEKSLRNVKLSAKAKMEQERAYRAAVEHQNQEFQGRVKSLHSELADARKRVDSSQSSIASLEKSNRSLQRTLAAKSAKENEQRMLAGRIKEGFEKAGIDAQIDLLTC